MSKAAFTQTKNENKSSKPKVWRPLLYKIIAMYPFGSRKKAGFFALFSSFYFAWTRLYEHSYLVFTFSFPVILEHINYILRRLQNLYMTKGSYENKPFLISRNNVVYKQNIKGESFATAITLLISCASSLKIVNLCMVKYVIFSCFLTFVTEFRHNVFKISDVSTMLWRGFTKCHCKTYSSPKNQMFNIFVQYMFFFSRLIFLRKW